MANGPDTDAVKRQASNVIPRVAIGYVWKSSKHKMKAVIPVTVRN